MKIVDVPLKMQKFYGSGKMLHPDIETIEELLQIIPYGKVSLIDSLCEKMARDQGVSVTCPMRTGNAIKKISEGMTLSSKQNTIPFWRIIRKNHMLINSSSTADCAAKLINEGFKIEQNNKGEFKILELEERLFSFL